MPVAGSAHHAIYWRRRPPEGTGKRPAILQTARARIEQALLERRGSLWHAFAEQAPVYRIGEDGVRRAAERKRALRSDGAVNLASLLNVMIASTDLASSLVAAVNKPGARWQSKSWADLGGFAYGEQIQDEVSSRRVERHARVLQDMGLIRSVQWFVYDTKTGRVRSPASKKFITAKLWSLLGLAQAMKALRKAREKERNKERLQRVTGLSQPKPGERPAAAASGAQQRPNAGAYLAPGQSPQRPPPRPDRGSAGPAGAAAIEAIKKMLGS